MIRETRIILKNAGRINPESIDDYLASGGYQGLRKALAMEPVAIIDEILGSGLRGRGGAGFSTGMKNRFTSQSCPTCPDHYLVVNADEGEPGTFKDRIIMENDPHLFIEGTVISARSIMATKGYIYLRGEYTRAIELTRKAIEAAYQHGLLGKNILGSGFNFDLEIKLGAGSYLCGEELTLIESLEGKRGNPRIKPPFPAEKGLFGQPTLVNNVETLANIPSIIVNGKDWYRRFGSERSPGTKLFTISGKVKKPGCYEVEFGTTLRQLIFGLAGGMLSAYKPFKAALLGGAAGTFADSSMLDERMTYDNLREKGLTLGSGAVIVLEEGDQIAKVLLNCLRFFKHESCGKCVPCRVGTAILENQAMELPLNKNTGRNQMEQMILQAEIMAATSLCPLGQSPILPLKSAYQFFSSELAL
ncbi:MAG TPA: NADH-ubiquinone oxidoreductase-F iron-sulfur binding region domain-containing protein [Bacteroidales bacterium]|nr:NADH-ubiquinone oxidoreductase-F iron-sulfur binding region domain-containing protein [Bacteroidales bacterium]